MTRSDQTEFLDIITRYYLLLDAFEELEALEALFTDDAVWTCYAAGAAQPHLHFDPVAQFRAVAAREGHLARAAGTRHHVTGLSTVATERGARSTIKVLVTIQPDRRRPPLIRETAIVTCDWVRQGDAWKIAYWRIGRDSIDAEPS
jgi:hypothetical protein